jgi:hypothetical protein
MITALVMVTGLAILCVAGMTLGSSTQRMAGDLRDRYQALHLAEAGLSDALLVMGRRLADGDEPTGAVGYQPAPGDRERDVWSGPHSNQNPADLLHMGAGFYWAQVTLLDADANLYLVTSTGMCNRERRSVEAVVQAGDGENTLHAIYGGNASGDPAYSLDLGGLLLAADAVEGEVYSGGDVVVSGNAAVNGLIGAAGSITGAAGNEGVTSGAPDFTTPDYESNHDFDVAALFAADAYMSGSLLGGNALQVPEDNPAHILRKNPDDRALETAGTIKDDDFLEDPYEPIGVDLLRDGSDPTMVTLSGDGQLGASGTDAVYYIDGNLWIHNLTTFSMKIQSAAGARITFAVKGNIYIGDNLWSNDLDLDGIAFVALADPAEPQSGSVFLGGPLLGTTNNLDGFFFAEKDVVVENALGALTVNPLHVRGTLTAGERYLNEEVINGLGALVHAPVRVDRDERVLDGTLNMPSLPLIQSATGGDMVVVTRQLARTQP